MTAVASSPAFVGRAAELTRLEKGLESARDGQVGAFLLAGEAGVGKTRLLGQLVSRAEQQGAVALVGGCLDLEEGRLPFGPFVEALRNHVRGLDPAERARLGRVELGHILPELMPPAGRATADAAVAQGRLFELMLDLVERLAGRAPLVLVVEDLHWSDRSTRDLLAFLARNLRFARVLLIATYRSDELFRGHPLRSFLAELDRTRRLERIELQPLTREELAAMVSGIAGTRADAAFVDSIFARSAGNPFFAEELVAVGAAGEEIPPSLKEVLLARLERLTPGAQELLRVVAVGGRAVRDGLLAAVSEMPDGARLAALRDAVAHHVLVPDHRDAYVFRHELLREAVYQELLPEERARLHAAYGNVLSSGSDLVGDGETVVGDLARHWFAAHDLPRAFVAAVNAARVAETRSGFAEAQNHYERALELWDRVPQPEQEAGLGRTALARHAAEVANLAGEHTRAAALVRQAIARLEREGQETLAGPLWERLGRFLWAAGDSRTALEAYERAVALVPDHPPSAARARVLAARGQSLMLLARYEDSRRCCEEAIAIARLVHARAEEGHALNTLGCDLAYLGDVDTAVSHLEAARSIAEEVGDLDDLFRAYLNLSDLLIGPVTRVEEGLALALEGVERSTQKGMAGDYGVSLQSNAATALVQLGRFDEADEILGAARRRNPSEMAAIDLHRCWARVELCRGRFEQAATHVGLVHQLMVKTVDPPYRAPLRAIEAELALWQGCLAEAHRAVSDGLRELDGAEDLWLAAPLLWCGIRAQAELALAQRGGQGSKEAQDPTLAAADLLERSRRLCSGATSVAPATRGYLSLCEAEAKRLTRADESGAWETAAAGWAALHQPYLETYARWREAEALLAQRQTRRGAHALERAERSAAQIGAEALLTEVRALARRARVELPLRQPATAATSPAPRPARDGRAGLTARQLEVLELVAAGMTNREIAQRLFITEKTAGAHVSSILATLRVRSRVEAATAAHRMGLTSGNSVG